MAKTCVISRCEFDAGAKPIVVLADGAALGVAVPKEFSTGSLGWNINGKGQFMVAGKLVECQIGLNITVIGSKELPAAAA